MLRQHGLIAHNQDSNLLKTKGEYYPAPDLGSGAARRGGSSPSTRTIFLFFHIIIKALGFFLFFPSPNKSPPYGCREFPRRHTPIHFIAARPTRERHHGQARRWRSVETADPVLSRRLSRCRVRKHFLRPASCPMDRYPDLATGRSHRASASSRAAPARLRFQLARFFRCWGSRPSDRLKTSARTPGTTRSLALRQYLREVRMDKARAREIRSSGKRPSVPPGFGFQGCSSVPPPT